MRRKPFRNSLLKALDPEIIGRLSLVPVTFPLRYEIEIPGNPIRELHFVEEGMASMTSDFSNGAQVEVCTFGYKSVIGVSALMGARRSLNRIYTQIAGNGYSCPLQAARLEFERGGLFQSLVLQYVHAQLLQTLQSVSCNTQHAIDQRLARWLLICADRTGTGTFRMSHEFLAQMLGNSRPAVSLAAAVLKAEGLIEYDRGAIRILDAARLEAKACECFAIVSNYLQDPADFEGGALVA